MTTFDYQRLVQRGIYKLLNDAKPPKRCCTILYYMYTVLSVKDRKVLQVMEMHTCMQYT